MSSPEVDQLSVLSGLLKDALERFRPRDFLLLGCSTGNGLEHVDPVVTRSVTGAGRVLETECGDPLFNDPFARDLVEGLLFYLEEAAATQLQRSRNTRLRGQLDRTGCVNTEMPGPA